MDAQARAVQPFAEALVDLLDAPTRAAAFGENGRRQAETCHSWTLIGRETASVYSRVLDGEGAVESWARPAG